MIVFRIVRGFFRVLGFGVKWTLMLGGLLILVAVIAGIVALVQASNSSNKAAGRITPRVYREVTLGETPVAVRKLLGKPERTDTVTISGLTVNGWSYGMLSSGSTFRFCFSNGKLAFKSRF